MAKFVLVMIMVGFSNSALAGEQPCQGDCNMNGSVAVNELILGVNILLGRADVSQCAAVDRNSNGTISVSELVAAVNSALNGCRGGGATFSQVQAIFTANCATPLCHVPPFPAGQMDLSEGAAFDQIVGVTASNFSAANDGLLRVNPGDATNSFIVIKVSGIPPFEFGSRMPLLRDPLGEAEVRTIREWIDAGANP